MKQSGARSAPGKWGIWWRRRLRLKREGERRRLRLRREVGRRRLRLRGLRTTTF